MPDMNIVTEDLCSVHVLYYKQVVYIQAGVGVSVYRGLSRDPYVRWPLHLPSG